MSFYLIPSVTTIGEVIHFGYFCGCYSPRPHIVVIRSETSIKLSERCTYNLKLWRLPTLFITGVDLYKSSALLLLMRMERFYIILYGLVQIDTEYLKMIYGANEVNLERIIYLD